MNAAQLVVRCLEQADVQYVFGVPGAKIDAVFDALHDSPIRLILCRHEQNAVFMAGAYGRITGKPGVVLVTSGPGVANLATGLLTATSEGDPIVAIGGAVPRRMRLRDVHQNADNAKLLDEVTKSSVEISRPNTIPEVMANAFREAQTQRQGACFISIPQDVLSLEVTNTPVNNIQPTVYGRASLSLTEQAADLINQAKLPVVLLGQDASKDGNVAAIRDFLRHCQLPFVVTYQAAGVNSRDLLPSYIGRIGLFKNQPGDDLLDRADVIIAIGFHPIEYPPEVWHANKHAKIINVAYHPEQLYDHFQPTIELIGDVAKTTTSLMQAITPRADVRHSAFVATLNKQLLDIIRSGENYNNTQLEQRGIHPLQFIHDLRATLNDDDYVIGDIGSVYMWLARYYLCFEPRHLLFSNGQQTLGVALPWAMATRLIHPDKKIVSISGDGGFLYSAMELETAVREKLNFVHCVWTDGAYDMVLQQELLKYNRTSGVNLGKVDVVQFAESFGAAGFRVESPDQFVPILIEAFKINSPVLIDIPIDYSDNKALFHETDPDEGS